MAKPTLCCRGPFSLSCRAAVISLSLSLSLSLSIDLTGAAWAGGLGLPTSRGVLGFGNLEDFTGIRVNLADDHVAQVTGLNVTFWKPGQSNHGLYRGIQLSLVGQGARLTQGLSLSGLGLGSGDLQGIGLGGLGVGADRITGVAAGGLGVGGDDITGLAVGGLGVGGDDITGLAVGGFGVGGDDITGVVVGGLGVGGERLRGLGTGAYTHFQEAHGLCLGVFNRTRILRGVQIGLLNHAGNNPRGLQWLPGINVHF